MNSRGSNDHRYERIEHRNQNEDRSEYQGVGFDHALPSGHFQPLHYGEALRSQLPSGGQRGMTRLLHECLTHPVLA